MTLGDTMIIPTVIEKSSMGERAYDIYSRLLKNRIVIISGEIDDNMANIVIAELLYLDSLNNDDIQLYINSPGGSITSGMAIFDTMNFVKSDVVTTGIGLAASMGAFLLSCGAKGKRYILPNTEVMIHQPLGGIQGQATEIDIAAKRIINLRKRLNTIMGKNTNKSLKQIEKDTERDYFMDAKEALEYGIIDKILY
jgi:ATP-dependent Clp protease protease subunit